MLINPVNSVVLLKHWNEFQTEAQPRTVAIHDGNGLF